MVQIHARELICRVGLRGCKRKADVVPLLALSALMAVLILRAASATTTTLTLSNSSVTTGTAVTFTAAVSNGGSVTTGTVDFCEPALGSCMGLGLLRTAQLTSAGTAVVKIMPAIGSHSYKAIFVGTSSNASSTSSAQAISVTGTYASTTALSSSGSAGNYTLTGTVVGKGSVSLSPTGSVSFIGGAQPGGFGGW